MNYIEIVTGALIIAGVAGSLAAWYKRSEGKDSLELAQGTISLYKDREAAYVQQVTELTATNLAKDATILELRNTIKTMVKEFKDYKNGSN